jgi:hypothetical protein
MEPCELAFIAAPFLFTAGYFSRINTTVAFFITQNLS